VGSRGGAECTGCGGRAESIVGRGWHNAIVKCKFLRKNRKGWYKSNSTPVRPSETAIVPYFRACRRRTAA